MVFTVFTIEFQGISPLEKPTLGNLILLVYISATMYIYKYIYILYVDIYIYIYIHITVHPGARVRFGNRFGRMFASLRTFCSNRDGRKVDIPSSSDSGRPVLGFRLPACCGFAGAGSWFFVLGGVPGPGLRVPGSWFLLLASFLVLGSLFSVFGLWFRVISLFRSWFLVLDVKAVITSTHARKAITAVSDAHR